MKQLTQEETLVDVLRLAKEQGNLDTMAIILQSFIATFGPLSEETGAAVRQLLADAQTQIPQQP